MKTFASVRRFARSDRGESLLEFAISAIIVLTVLFGVMDFSRALYTYHFISHAAQHGARFAEVHGSAWSTTCTTAGQLGCTISTSSTATDVQDYLRTMVPPGVTASNLTATATWPGTDINGSSAGACGTTINYAGCLVKVKVTYQFNFIVPFMPASAQTFSSTAEAVIQQ